MFLIDFLCFFFRFSTVVEVAEDLISFTDLLVFVIIASYTNNKNLKSSILTSALHLVHQSLYIGYFMFVCEKLNPA